MGVQSWLKSLLEDSMVKIFIKNSNLTKTQLETFLIDVLAENMAGKTLKYDEKARMRLLRGGVSRGAFNRTLRQARVNVIRSVYTVLLLGYLGVFETTSLDPYLEVANKLQTYLSAYRGTGKEQKGMDEQVRIMNMLRAELESSLEDLSRPKTPSRKM